MATNLEVGEYKNIGEKTVLRRAIFEFYVCSQ